MPSTRTGAASSARRPTTDYPKTSKPAREDQPSTRRAAERSAGAIPSATTTDAGAATGKSETPTSPQADMTAPIDPADDLGQQGVHTDPPSNEGAPSVGADGPPMFGKGSGHQIGRRVHSELFCPPPLLLCLSSPLRHPKRDTFAILFWIRRSIAFYIRLRDQNSKN